MVQVENNPAEIGMASGSSNGHLYDTDTLLRRMEKVRARMEEKGLDSLLVSNPFNRRYLSGFTGEDQPPLDTAGFLIVGRDELCLVTDGRYNLQAAAEMPGELRVSVALRTGKMAGAVAEQIGKRGYKRLGFETAHLTHMLWRQIDKSLPDTELIATHRLVEPLRMQKDEGEIAIMRQAISISDRAFDIVSSRITPGMTEKQVAWEIERTMRDLGAEERAFGTIVAGGPNGAMAHAVPGDRPIGEGEPVVIDMGARLHGYNSDMTRTLCFGEPSDKFREIYNLVLEAHLEAERQLKAGINGIAGDATGRDIIEAAGYGEQFNHSLGHGIGLEVHEGPSLSKVSEDTIPENAISSVEPGIYIAGWGGVRIEDLVLFRPDGVEVLTQAGKHIAY
jgi:Xaa-Pro aminopeptidase